MIDALWPGDRPARPRAAWPAAVATAAFAIALGAPLVVAALVGDVLRYPASAAGLRAAWIGLYAVVGLYFAWRRPEWELGLLMTSVGAIAAVASLDALEGEIPYTVARIATVALVPVSALMLLALPVGRIDADRGRRWILVTVPIILATGTAYLMLAPTAPWSQAVSQCRDECAASAIQVVDAPGVAHALLWPFAAAGVGSIAVALVVLVRQVRAATPVARRTLTPISWLTVIWGVPLSVGLVMVATDPGPERLSPYLVSTGIIRAALPLALLAAMLAFAARTRAIQDALVSRFASARDTAEVEHLIAEALQDPSLRLAFRDGSRWIGVEGRMLPPETTSDDRGRLAIAMSGGAAGALTFDPALRSQEGRVQAIAALAAIALERARIDAELAAVRKRLVAVAEDERRRIERSLHDGAQQHLVGMMLRMGVAREVLLAQPDMAPAILRDLGLEVQHALDELRELSHGLYPPVLVDHGLAEALRSAARHSAVPVETEIRPVGRFEPSQEAAVYFCCAEALQNALKHAGADTRIRLRLWLDDDAALTFEVDDDGRGFIPEPPATGSGLMGMRDRVESVGGTLVIDSAPGRGTAVRGTIPAAAVRGVAPGDGTVTA